MARNTKHERAIRVHERASLPILGVSDILESRVQERRQQERVNHPTYYGGDTIYEVIKVIDAWGLGFALGNAVKYIARAGKKFNTSDVEDLKKARWYLDHEIQRREREQPKQQR